MYVHQCNIIIETVRKAIVKTGRDVYLKYNIEINIIITQHNNNKWILNIDLNWNYFISSATEKYNNNNNNWTLNVHLNVCCAWHNINNKHNISCCDELHGIADYFTVKEQQITCSHRNQSND